MLNNLYRELVKTEKDITARRWEILGIPEKKDDRLLKFRSPQVDFIFTRDKQTDYEFILWSDYPPTLQKKVVFLQDYFANLINNEGWYCFKADGDWVIANTRRLNESDHVGRPLYHVSGKIIPGILETRWNTFLDFNQNRNYVSSQPYTPGEFDSKDFPNFLALLRNSSRPVSFAYGTRPARLDNNGLQFDHRFIAKKESVEHNSKRYTTLSTLKKAVSRTSGWSFKMLRGLTRGLYRILRWLFRTGVKILRYIIRGLVKLSAVLTPRIKFWILGG